jgi:hypothetical protein
MDHNNLSYYDFETKEVRNLLNEIVNHTLEVRVSKGIDCNAYPEGNLENGRQFMPFYVSKIISRYIFENPTPESKYRVSLEESIKNKGNFQKLICLRSAADDNVACAVLIKEKNRFFSDRELLGMAVAEYTEASKLKKLIKQDENAGQKLAYIANNLGIYVPVIDEVFNIFKRRQDALSCSERLMCEIDYLVSEDDTPVEAKVDAYIRLRHAYTEEKEIETRIKMKDSLRKMFFSIEQDNPCFRDDAIFDFSSKELAFK